MSIIKSNLTTLSLSLLFVAVFSGCSGDDNSPPAASPAYQYEPPEADADWQSAHLDEVSLDPAAFETMMNRRDLGAENIHGILIVKDGMLVFEEYFNGRDSEGLANTFDKDTVHEQFSVTKSIASLLMGIAIDRGEIPNLDERTSTYLPEYSGLFADPLKADMTLYDVLTMQSGIEWFELGTPRESSSRTLLVESDAPITYLLSQPSVSEPGTTFLYNTGVASLVSEIIEHATSSSIDVFAEAYLFTPLNINTVSWQRHEDGHVFSGTGLKLLPRDMAKIGQLMLNGGSWRGTRIVSDEWLMESTMSHIAFQANYPNYGYGYYWWMRDFRISEESVTGVVFASGFGGQMIYILPEFDTVVVFTAGNFDGGGGAVPEQILEEDILPNLVPQ